MRGETRCHHFICYSFRLTARYFIWTPPPPPTDKITHTTTFVNPVVEHWLEVKINTLSSQCVVYFVLLQDIPKHACDDKQYMVQWCKREKCFYLTTHSTHFIYGYMASDHSDSEKGNPLPPHRLLFPISSKGSFICTIPQTG